MGISMSHVRLRISRALPQHMAAALRSVSLLPHTCLVAFRVGSAATNPGAPDHFTSRATSRLMPPAISVARVRGRVRGCGAGVCVRMRGHRDTHGKAHRSHRMLPGLKPVGCEVKLLSKDEWHDRAAFV